MKLILLICLIFVLSFANAQESNNGKRLFAKSLLNQKAPELIVEKWISPKPETIGKFVLLDFSSTWCHACRKAMPELNGYQKDFSDKLVVIFVTSETVEKVKAAKGILIENPIAIDTQKRITKLLDVKGIPHNLLIDPKGYVRWEGFPANRDFELSENVIATLIEKYQ